MFLAFQLILKAFLLPLEDDVLFAKSHKLCLLLLQLRITDQVTVAEFIIFCCFGTQLLLYFSCSRS